MAIEVSLIAWLTNNYDSIDIDETKIYVNLVSIIIISIVIIVVNKIAFKKMDELEEI